MLERSKLCLILQDSIINILKVSMCFVRKARSLSDLEKIRALLSFSSNTLLGISNLKSFNLFYYQVCHNVISVSGFLPVIVLGLVYLAFPFYTKCTSFQHQMHSACVILLLNKQIILKL